MDVAVWTIRSEEDAWALLKEACGDGLSEEFSLNFEKWPVLEIKFEGDQFNSNISAKMMQGFIELQNNVNRIYAKLLYNQPSVRHLTDEDKYKVEVLVQVLPGSSGYKVDLQQILEKFVEGVAGKVTGKQVVILAIAGGLMWTSHSAWKSYLQHQKDVRNIEAQQFAGSQETEKMRILASAMKQEPHVVTVKVDAEEMYNTMLKAASKSQQAHLPGATIKGSEAKQLVRAKRTPSTEVRLDGRYRVVKIDNSKADHFEVRVTNDQITFTARLDQSVILTKEQNKKYLEEALWTRQPLNLMIQGTQVRDEISQATILDVMDRYYE
jgi:hypothetical protein